MDKEQPGRLLWIQLSLKPGVEKVEFLSDTVTKCFDIFSKNQGLRVVF